MQENDLLKLLWENMDTFISGETLAARLGVSRTAVWKAAKALRGRGYRIDSAPNRGYRLSSESDVLSAEGIARHLKDSRLRVEYTPVIGSTNTALKERAASGAEEGLALAAGEQTDGRGRMGRRFFSPPDSGIYMSLLLRPKRSAVEAAQLTAAAAVAAAESIEALSGLPAGIKWVNDVLIGGKKVCGILTEASVNWESGTAEYVVVGIGVNTRPPAGDFPAELREIAGAVFTDRRPPELRCRLAAAILDRLMELYDRPGSEECYTEYRRRSTVLGREINILIPGREPVQATVLDIDRDYALRVRLSDGREEKISSGEISIRPR